MIVLEKHDDSFVVLKLLNSASILSLAYKGSGGLSLLLLYFLANLFLTNEIDHWSGFVVFCVKVGSKVLLGVLGGVGSETAESVGAVECAVCRFFEGRHAWLFHIGFLLSDWAQGVGILVVFLVFWISIAWVLEG
jgi:hypothetical protein